jgi:hypothetical protein
MDAVVEGANISGLLKVAQYVDWICFIYLRSHTPSHSHTELTLANFPRSAPLCTGLSNTVRRP